MKVNAKFLSVGPIGGLQKFKLEKPIEVAHWHESEAHIVRTEIVYRKENQTFVFCQKHNEYFDITLEEKNYFR